MIRANRPISRLALPRFGELLRSRNWALLLAIVALFILSPFLEHSLLDRLLYALLTLFVLVTAIRASTFARHNLRTIATVTAGLWVALVPVRIILPGMPQELAGDMLFLALGLFTVSTMLGRVLTAKRVDFDVLCGTAAVYLLLALIWAFTYVIVETVSPGSFSGLNRGDLTEFLYFSLTTISTLGYGDILPVNPWARVWAGLQAAVGVFYMAAVVARLVNAYGR